MYECQDGWLIQSVSAKPLWLYRRYLDMVYPDALVIHYAATLLGLATRATIAGSVLKSMSC